MVTNRLWTALAFVAVVVIAALGVLLAMSRVTIAENESDLSVLRHDNALQGQTIAMQSLDFQRFNQAALEANRLNSLIDASTENTVIEYREILHREKTCDLPVPAHIAGGLLEYTNRLRASAMHSYPQLVNATGDSAVTSGTLTYCQAVLWIKPLLGAIEKANNQLGKIRRIDVERQTRHQSIKQ
ncbi:hypothetical protein [Citrobacter amalonaticus]|uniref:hypothetical protein n=1 Tax=Citrobacter amalonaticus TaxID=35703 RepID=UPI000A3D2F31|nr:hypothetical protein [Citrobacter amalonaticus]OUE50312.1 hypothetical protein AZ012_004705 [Citrobacter amalonaticus]